MNQTPLDRVIEVLEALAPPALAEPWDNVGLLLAPSTPRAIRTILLTIDLTPAVVDEAIVRRAELIVAYHPPLFHAVKRLVPAAGGTSALVRLIEERIAVYSPHTALDAAAGGVNDWLMDAFAPGLRRALQRPRAVVHVTTEAPRAVGQGRLLVLDVATPLAELVAQVKRHLRLRQVAVAVAERHRDGQPISSIAACAGAGTEVIGGAPADLLLTGEMRHHDVLAALAAGRSVILCGHTNTERGYLVPLADRLRADLSARVQIHVSTADVDPLRSE